MTTDNEHDELVARVKATWARVKEVNGVPVLSTFVPSANETWDALRKDGRRLRPLAKTSDTPHPLTYRDVTRVAFYTWVKLAEPGAMGLAALWGTWTAIVTGERQPTSTQGEWPAEWAQKPGGVTRDDFCDLALQRAGIDPDAEAPPSWAPTITQNMMNAGMVSTSAYLTRMEGGDDE